MKRFFIALIGLFTVLMTYAQKEKPKFSPEKFQAEMEQFIAKEACLTPQESARFFPEYDEKNRKQRSLYDRMRRLGRVKPVSEDECKEIIMQRDKLDLELKQIQQAYHNKFMTLISASKLFDVIKAEDKFHRRMLKKYNHATRQNDKK